MFTSFLIALQLALVSGAGQSLELDSSRVQLNPEDWSQDRVGQLAWCGGLELTSEDDNFGGLSGLLISDDGQRLTSVSDRGEWMTAALDYGEDGCLRGLGEGVTGGLWGLTNQRPDDEYEMDAEALELGPGGEVFVAFEGDHRIWRYPAGVQSLAKPAQALPEPVGLMDLPHNGGIEALVSLDDGRLLAMTEDRQEGDYYAALIFDGQSWTETSYHSKGRFAPTGAALLPNGDIIVVERRFTILGGFAARVSRIAAADVRPGQAFSGQELAVFRPPLTYDNLEGIAAHQAPDGSLRLTLVSDDNFSPLQRTLLLMFRLDE